MLRPFVLRKTQQADFKLIELDVWLVEAVEMSRFDL